jgi:hypothetical protein
MIKNIILIPLLVNHVGNCFIIFLVLAITSGISVLNSAVTMLWRLTPQPVPLMLWAGVNQPLSVVSQQVLLYRNQSKLCLFQISSNRQLTTSNQFISKLQWHQFPHPPLEFFQVISS